MAPTTPSVRVFAPAKINLFLHVGDKRADGFHALESLAVFVDVGDELAFAPSPELSLAIDGPFAGELTGEGDNLVLKAARALGMTAAITLTKNLPVASGIGGGSADAAAVLRGLGKGRHDLREIAEALGSDVPVCVPSKPAWMEGRGEILTPMTVPEMHLVLVNPRVGVSTAAVFRALERRSGLGAVKSNALDGTRNDLEAPARALQPVIGEVLDAIATLPGARLARMSGSGATCFGLFGEALVAARAAEQLAAKYPGWWVRATRTLQ
ncbi:MAG TPA: 4-(cytidine 5'-diphospho)-2-C-methyl-D-erythritol kinase [Rhizomicrobium sp.]|nr:4-(cytidine 5'-diphospho)-2-C-methyl-D-erythritol kinase [Rhizomicrobium sp.]